MLSAYIDQGPDPVVDPFNFSFVFSFGVADPAPFTIDVIPGVDPDLFNMLRCDQCRFWLVVYVGDQGGAIASCPEFLFDDVQVFSLPDPGSRDPDVFAARFDHPDRLLHRRQGVHGVGGGHGLDADRVVPTEGHITNLDDAGGVCC